MFCSLVASMVWNPWVVNGIEDSNLDTGYRKLPKFRGQDRAENCAGWGMEH